MAITLKSLKTKKLHNEVARAIDKQRLGVTNGYLLAKLPEDEQFILLEQAVHMNTEALKDVIAIWQAKPEDVRSGISHLYYLWFHASLWAGSLIGDEVDEFERDCRNRRQFVEDIISAAFDIPLAYYYTGDDKATWSSPDTFAIVIAAENSAEARETLASHLADLGREDLKPTFERRRGIAVGETIYSNVEPRRLPANKRNGKK